MAHYFHVSPHFTYITNKRRRKDGMMKGQHLPKAKYVCISRLCTWIRVKVLWSSCVIKSANLCLVSVLPFFLYATTSLQVTSSDPVLALCNCCAQHVVRLNLMAWHTKITHWRPPHTLYQWEITVNELHQENFKSFPMISTESNGNEKRN